MYTLQNFVLVMQLLFKKTQQQHCSLYSYSIVKTKRLYKVH